MLGRLTAVAIVLLLLPGCLQQPAPAEAPAAPAPGADAPSGEPMNLWLLDGPRPAVEAAVSGGAEPSILVDRFGGTVWIGDTSGLYRSGNGGATWTKSPNPFVPFIFGDGWALAQDDVGTLYASTTNGPMVGVARSNDRGQTWERTVSGVLADADVIADRPWIAARGNGEVSLVINPVEGQERCATSMDRAQTFLRRGIAGTPNAGNLVYDHEGGLVFANDDHIFRIASCSLGHYALPLPPHGPQIFVQVGVNDQDQQFVALPSPTSDAMTIVGYKYLAPATQKILAVSPPELKANTFGAISVRGDEIAVAWYGTETAGAYTQDGFNGAWNVYVARVTGFWTDSPTITHTRLTTVPNHVGDFCMNGVGCTTGPGDRDLLDYMGITHDEAGNVHVAYGHDGAGSRPEVRYARIDA